MLLENIEEFFPVIMENDVIRIVEPNFLCLLYVFMRGYHVCSLMHNVYFELELLIYAVTLTALLNIVRQPSKSSFRWPSTFLSWQYIDTVVKI